MAESAEERRARLKAMRAEAQAAAQHEDDAMEEDQREDRQQSSQDASVSGKEDGEPVLRFRNYLVKDDKSIAHTKVEPAQAPALPEIVADPDAVIGKDPEEVLINVAPKKPNWELRRAIAPQLARLDRQTQEAMIVLMKREQGLEA